jgi:hypothetical protein
MNTITNNLAEWTKCFSQHNTVCPLWHWCSHNLTKLNCEYYHQTFPSYTAHSRHKGQYIIWLYVLTWWWQSCAKRNSNIKLQWILLYSAEYTAILINGYSKLIMWTVIVSLYMQNLQYVVTERIILIFSKQYVQVTSTNADIQDCDEVVCKQ